MSSELPDTQAANNVKIPSGDGHNAHEHHPHEHHHHEHHPHEHHAHAQQSPKDKFLVPSPVPTRRNRTYSESQRLLDGETHNGVVKEFCRNKGHGFIIDDKTKETVFVHISDIDGDIVPKEGDDVTFKMCTLPFNTHKTEAVHVKISHLASGVAHETWNAKSSSPARSPRT